MEEDVDAVGAEGAGGGGGGGGEGAGVAEDVGELELEQLANTLGLEEVVVERSAVDGQAELLGVRLRKG